MMMMMMMMLTTLSSVAPGTAVARPQAQFPDGSRQGISYSLFSGNRRHVFSISSSTGQWRNTGVTVARCEREADRMTSPCLADRRSRCPPASVQWD